MESEVVESLGRLPFIYDVLERDLVEEIDRRRSADNLRGDGLRAFGIVAMASDCLLRELGSTTICTSWGFPTEVNETNLAVSSCDFRLDPREEGDPNDSTSSIGEKSTREPESE